MKLSIWQQFSSNHSADFTVVGTFASHEAALAGKDKLIQIIRQVGDWYFALAEDERTSWIERTSDAEVITPIEIDLSRQYEISWDVSLLNYRNVFYHADEYIGVRQNHLMIEETPSIWVGPQPFPSLITKVGAELHYDVSESRSHSQDRLLLVDIELDIPADKDAADLL